MSVPIIKDIKGWQMNFLNVIAIYKTIGQLLENRRRIKMHHIFGRS